MVYRGDTYIERLKEIRPPAPTNVHEVFGEGFFAWWFIPVPAAFPAAQLDDILGYSVPSQEDDKRREGLGYGKGGNEDEHEEDDNDKYNKKKVKSPGLSSCLGAVAAAVAVPKPTSKRLPADEPVSGLAIILWVLCFDVVLAGLMIARGQRAPM